MTNPIDPSSPREAAPAGLRFTPHALRAHLLGEVHARPFRPAAAPRVFLHHAFVVERERFADDRRHLEALCRSRGVPGPAEDGRHHVIPFGGGVLQWERHAEFVTYSWDGPARDATQAFASLPPEHPFGAEFVAPGPLLVAARVDLLRDAGALEAATRHFDAASLCVSHAGGEGAIVLTDFRQDGDGRTRILVLDRGLNTRQAGALVQQLLEIETYRTLAMLGLPTAQSVAPDVRRVEHALAEITAAIRATEGLEANRGLLEHLSGLTAELEADAAGSSFRFGATRAYDQIVKDRLDSLGERPVPGHVTWSAFLARRSEPAMRTVLGTQERIDDLSSRLSRAAQLLRTRVDIDLEHQNLALLESMNRRTSPRTY